MERYNSAGGRKQINALDVIVGRVSGSLMCVFSSLFCFRLINICLVGYMTFFLCVGALAQDPCSRVAGKWKCRICGYLNKSDAKYCLRDHANLEEQRSHFRKDLAPLFEISPKRVDRGDSAILSWYTSCSDHVVIEPGVGEVSPYGTIRISPSDSTIYRIHIDSEWADWMAMPNPLSLQVIPLMPEVDFRLWPAHIWAGDSVALAWKSRNSSSLVIEPSLIKVELSGQRIISNIQQNTNFRIEATGESGVTTVKQANLLVGQIPEPPPMADPPRYQMLFEQAVPSIFFPVNEPIPGRQLNAILSSETVSALDRFIAFLNQYPSIHFRIIGMAWENGISDRKPDSKLQQSLMVRRRDNIADYFLQRRIAVERIARTGDGTLKDVSFGTKLKGRTPNEPVPGVIFEFMGTPPEINAEIFPTKIFAGEAAYLIWNTRNAEQVFVDPKIGQTELRGRVRVMPDHDSKYLVSARNAYSLTSNVFLNLNVLPAPDHEPILSAEKEIWPPPEVNDVFFGYRSASLSPEARKLLSQTAGWLTNMRNRQFRITLNGGSDTTEPIALARQRAEACRRFLIDEGIAFARLTIGKSRPSSINIFDSIANARAWRAMQRRVQLIVERPQRS
jgi:outer membrane protein OmpA-like peptidoglycan-associated protein